MWPEWGHFALLLALGLALVQSVAPFLPRLAAREGHRWVPFTTLGQFLLVSFSIAVLASAFMSNDFTVAYVAENSNSHLPFYYRFCALWGGHEGSMLLWVFILNAWMLLVSCCSRALPAAFRTQVLAIMAMISVGFLLFILCTSDPFVRVFLQPLREGRDLNPILQDPGLVSHPPLLYMGYVGFSVAFAFAIAALLSGKMDAEWARWARPWTVAAWCFLTVGIVLGSVWSYRELGWGGWWFWDPVENASFMPWLAGTALFHSLRVAERRQTFRGWTVLLAIVAFSLSLLGTFLVRSGVLISVHAFAVDPARGFFIFMFLSIVVGSALTLYAIRVTTLKSSVGMSWRSREALLLYNNVLLVSALCTVLLGTLYPLLLDALGLDKLSVGAPYFNTVFIPLMIPVFVLMAIAPWLHWQDSTPAYLLRRMGMALVFLAVALLAAFILPWYFAPHFSGSVFLGVALAVWVLLHSLALLSRKGAWRARRLGVVFAHGGVAVTVLGIVLVTAYQQELDLSLQPGETVAVAGYTFHFLEVQAQVGPNYKSMRSHWQIDRGPKHVADLFPEMRYYTAQDMAVAKTAIDVGVFRDLYVALGQVLDAKQNRWAVRVYYKPFVRWIWAGGLLMVLGGILSLKRKRFQ